MHIEKDARGRVQIHKMRKIGPINGKPWTIVHLTMREVIYALEMKWQHIKPIHPNSIKLSMQIIITKNKSYAHYRKVDLRTQSIPPLGLQHFKWY